MNADGTKPRQVNIELFVLAAQACSPAHIEKNRVYFIKLLK